jgi:hypothetical protein
MDLRTARKPELRRSRADLGEGDTVVVVIAGAAAGSGVRQEDPVQSGGL